MAHDLELKMFHVLPYSGIVQWIKRDGGFLSTIILILLTSTGSSWDKECLTIQIPGSLAIMEAWKC